MVELNIIHPPINFYPNFEILWDQYNENMDEVIEYLINTDPEMGKTIKNNWIYSLDNHVIVGFSWDKLNWFESPYAVVENRDLSFYGTTTSNYPYVMLMKIGE